LRSTCLKDAINKTAAKLQKVCEFTGVFVEMNSYNMAKVQMFWGKTDFCFGYLADFHLVFVVSPLSLFN